MEGIRDLFKDSIQVSLLDIDYKAVTQEERNAVTRVRDSLDDLSFDGENLKLIVSRYVYFEPKARFDLKVTYSVTYFTRNDKSEELAKVLVSDIFSEVKSNTSRYASPAMNNVSLVIAVITSSFWNNPLVTPPNLIIPKVKENGTGVATF